jgi:hypothetical protein
LTRLAAELGRARTGDARSRAKFHGRQGGVRICAAFDSQSTHILL